MNIPGVIRGGNGNDRIVGSGGPTILIGDAGADQLVGRSDSDLLIGGRTTLDDSTLADILFAWSANKPYKQRVSSLRGALNSGTVLDDSATDVIFGGGSQDWYFASANDLLTDRKSNEFVN